MLGALVLLTLAGLPGAASAGLAPPETADDGIESRSLLEVREQLDRRLASQRRAQASVSRLSAEIEELRARLAETTAMLQATREEALALERRLDRLVPRLLARTAELEERRAQAGKALADLAAKERGAGLEPTTRARLSALGPLMLQRLRAAEAEVDALRQGRERTLERQARIERRLAALASERRHLERLRVETLGLRQSALARLHGLEAEVAVLAETETRLARRVLRAEAASVALGDPGPHAPASRAAPAFRSALAALSASVGKGALAANRSLETGGESLPESHVVAQAPAARDPGELEPGAGPVARIGPPRAALHGDGSAALPGDHAEGTGGASSVDVVYQPEGGLSDAEVQRERTQAPLLPLAEAIARRDPARGGPGLAIDAAPGQGVAAPVDGKVVFAGTFKSYGWLLILEHGREYHTLLWGFARLDVERGDQVHVGQIVGVMGARGDDPPVLHLERRRNGRPIDLAASSNGIQG